MGHKNYGSNNSIILGRKGYGWGEFPHYYLNHDFGKYGFPEGTDGRIATQVNISRWYNFERHLPEL